MRYFILILISICFGCKRNLPIPDKIFASDYFYLEVREIPYAFCLSHEMYSGLPIKPQRNISFIPEVKTDYNKIGIVITGHGRFDYIICNKAWGSIYQAMGYTNDIKEMKLTFQNCLNDDSSFNKCFQKMIAPFLKIKIKKDTFSINELLMVASRFFYCDEIDSRYRIGSHICIGINGQKESNWKKDYTALEAFSFETFFSLNNSKYTTLINLFSKNIMLSVKTYKTPYSYSTRDYLLLIRNEVYKKMIRESFVKEVLLNYYKENQFNLSFIIQ